LSARSKLDAGDGQLKIVRHGEVRKLVKRVAQITFIGACAIADRQDVIYVTGRAVFKLTSGVVELIEVAPGVDLKNVTLHL